MGSFDFEAEEGLSESMGYARVRLSERWVRVSMLTLLLHRATIIINKYFNKIIIIFLFLFTKILSNLIH